VGRRVDRSGRRSGKEGRKEWKELGRSGEE